MLRTDPKRPSLRDAGGLTESAVFATSVMLDLAAVNS
jgi:hypothetical protein